MINLSKLWWKMKDAHMKLYGDIDKYVHKVRKGEMKNEEDLRNFINEISEIRSIIYEMETYLNGVEMYVRDVIYGEPMDIEEYGILEGVEI